MIRLSKSCLSEAEKHSVIDVLDRGYLGMGAEVQSFESELSRFFLRSVVCTINGTAALHLALQACGIGKGDEVLVPSLTYVASFQAIAATGATPIACDISQNDYLLDIEDAKKRITSKTKAIMPVHFTGGVGDLDAIYRFSQEYGLRVIEDAAHAFGTTYKQRKVGSFGDLVCFSFDGIKNITSGEGGCIVTGDQQALAHIRDARLLGIEKDSDKRYHNERSWEFDVKHLGWRYHMSNIMAAIGLEQLKKFPKFSSRRRALARHYDRMFINHPTIQPLQRDYETVVPHIYVVRILGLTDRNRIQKSLLKKNIQVGYHYFPNHRLTAFKDLQRMPLPVTDQAAPELMSLPLHPDMTNQNVETVSSELIKLVNTERRVLKKRQDTSTP